MWRILIPGSAIQSGNMKEAPPHLGDEVDRGNTSNDSSTDYYKDCVIFDIPFV